VKPAIPTLTVANAACRAHRDVLLDFADGRGETADAGAAIAHLNGCRSCEEELARVMLAIVGLRRIREELASAQPSADAWANLRRRIEPRPRRPWLMRSPLPGIAMTLSIVAALAGPNTLLGSPGPSADSATSPVAPDAATTFERDRSLKRMPLPKEPMAIMIPLAAPPGVRLIGPDGQRYPLAVEVTKPRADRTK
jgi:anti-sigma factor RsiW